ncbi:MAG: hypothetical protein ABSA30_14160, partial [Candidatus Aminicenantales bacterium]
SALTFKELVSHIFKDVREDGASGNLVTSSEKALRRIGTRERTVLPAETPLTDFDSIRVRGDGRRYLILMIGAETEATEVPGGGAAIVAVFPEGSAEPQDMAEVKADRLCFFGETRLGLGPDDAFTIVNHHSNSNQAYLITELYRIQGGRFQLIDSVFTLSATGLCENSLQEVLTWQTEPDGASSHPKIVAAVSVRQGPGEDETPECLERGIKPRKLTFSETYRWDKAKNRYSRGGNGFEALDRLNEKNL